MLRRWILGLVILAVPAAADAASISYTDSISLATTNWTDSVSIQKFDPSLGTLTNVEIELIGSVLGTARAESLDAQAAQITLNLAATITLTRPDMSVLAVALPVSASVFNATAYDGVIDFGGTSGITLPGLTSSDSDTIISPPPASDLALFTGVGTILLPVMANGSSSASGAGNLITQFNTQASASVKVTYYYDAAVVPEPASVAMAAMGVIGVGGLALRRRVVRG
jgi:hypothetical protein